MGLKYPTQIETEKGIQIVTVESTNSVEDPFVQFTKSVSKTANHRRAW